MAILQTKYVAVGAFTYGSLANYGFNTATSIGTISNTSGGTSNVNLDSVYSGADVYICNWATTDGGSTGSVILQLTGNRANSGWATMTVGSTTFSRTAATYSYDSSNNRTSWNWSSNSNPFGTSGNVKVEWDDGGSSTTYSLSASPTTVASGNNVTFSWTASTSGTYYYNSTFFGGATGTVTGTSGTFSATASSSFSGAQTSAAAATLRIGSTSGAIVAGPVYVTIDKTPGQPSVAASSIGETSFVGTATAGSPNVGTLQVSINNSNWYTSPKTFTGLSAGTTYTLRARQVNGVAISSQGTTSVTTDSTTPTLELNISIGTDPVLLNSSTTTYTNSLTGCGSTTRYFAFYTAGASQGSTATYGSLGSLVGRTYNTSSSRTLYGPSASGTNISGPGNSTADTVYIWACATGFTIQSSTIMTYTGSSYVVDQPDTSITLTPSTTSLTHNDTTTNPTVNVTGDTSGTQYRLYTNDIPRWVSTYNPGEAGFTISYSESELPSAGNYYTYFSQARIPATNGGSGTWQNTGDSFIITRQPPPANYSVSASPTSINEGQSTTFTVTTSNVANGTTVGYTLSGITSGDITGNLTGTITINNNTGSVQVTFSNDATTEGSETATLTLASTDSNNASTGSPSASVTIADTSQGSSSSGGSGSLSTGSGAYGLEIRGLNGTAKVFTPGHRTFNVIAGGKLTLGSGVTTYPTALTNLGSAVSDETKISILVLAPFDGQLMIKPIRDANNGRIGFENTSGYSQTFRYQVHRIG
jgi:hypothetical protein